MESEYFIQPIEHLATMRTEGVQLQSSSSIQRTSLDMLHYVLIVDVSTIGLLIALMLLIRSKTISEPGLHRANRTKHYDYIVVNVMKYSYTRTLMTQVYAFSWEKH